MRRGQVSLFLIIAAVIVILAGVTVYVVHRLNTNQDNTLGTRTDLQPVEAFVTRCLEESTRASLIAAGETGGYVNPAELGFVANPIRPTESDSFQPFPNRPAMPYWHYLASPNDCTSCVEGSERPNLFGASPAIQGQLETDIAARTLTCIDDFSTFADTYTVTANAAPVVTVEFGERDTVAKLEYPITMDGVDGSSLSRNSFITTVDIPFKHLYTTATSIATRATDSGFFEGLTIEAITLETAGDKIPPVANGYDLSYDPGPIWSLVQVRGAVANVLQSDIGIVQLFASRNMNFVRSGDPMTDRLYANYYFNIPEDVSDVDATFMYLDKWEPYVRVSPGGQIIKPDRLTSHLFFLPQFKRMDFQYDVSYPVFIQLSADTSQGKYSFQFPIEVNVRNNKALEYASYGDDEVELESVCSDENAIGSKVTVTTHESSTGAAMNALVTYECLAEACNYGETVAGRATMQLPPCVGGTLVAEREGYRTARVAVDSVTAEAKQVDLSLVPYVEVAVDVKPMLIGRSSRGGTADDPQLGPWALQGTLPEFGPPYKAIVTFTPVDDPDYAQVAVIPAPEDGSPTNPIQLAPGDYDVSAVVIQELTEPHIIKGREVGTDGFIGIGEHHETIPDIVLGDGAKVTLDDGTEVDTEAGSMYVGGLTRDATTSRMTITEDMLADGVLTVPVIIVPLSELQVIDDLEALDQVTTFGADAWLE